VGVGGIWNYTCSSLSVFYLVKNLIADLNDRFCSLCSFSLLMLCSTESGAAVCEYFMRNMCNRGPLCPFRHTKGEKTVVCKHWLRGLCKKGDQCEFLHEYDMTKMPECYFYSKFGEFVLMLLGYYQHCMLADFLWITGVRTRLDWSFEKDPIIIYVKISGDIRGHFGDFWGALN